MGNTDIRQSDSWSEYLRMYGWESIKLSNGSNLRITSYLFTKRASLQMPNELTMKDLFEIDKICRENKVFFLKISPNANQDVNLLKELGYKQTISIELAPNTMFLDLTLGLNKLWLRFSSNCRYSINKSDRENCYTEIIKNPSVSIVENFYKIIAYRGSKKHFVIQNLKDMKKKVEVFGEQSFICNVYNSKNEILGTKLFLGHKNTIWGMHSGTTSIGQRSTGGYKLLFDCIKYFIDVGYKKMDVGGINDDRLKKLTRSWKNYSNYKREFNGDVVYFSLPYVKRFW